MGSVRSPGTNVEAIRPVGADFNHMRDDGGEVEKVLGSPPPSLNNSPGIVGVVNSIKGP